MGWKAHKEPCQLPADCQKKVLKKKKSDFVQLVKTINLSGELAKFRGEHVATWHGFASHKGKDSGSTLTSVPDGYLLLGRVWNPSSWRLPRVEL